MQGLTNSIRRASKANIRYGKQYERALASQIIMVAPMAPHFAAAPNHLNLDDNEIKWQQDVLQQCWPEIDMNYKVDLTIKVNGFENCVIKIARNHINNVTHNDVMDIAFNTDSVTSYLIDKKIRTRNFILYPGIEAILNIYVYKVKQEKGSTSKSDEKIIHEK